jgi:hypothetical protein
MSNMSDELKRTLNILPSGDMATEDVFEAVEPREPVEFILTEIPSSVPDLVLSDAKVDYIIARNHTYTLLEMTTTALATALSVAKETEHPRAFEAFNSLASTARNFTLDLLALQKTYKEVTKDREEMRPQEVKVTVTNENTPTTFNILEAVKAAIASGDITPLGENSNG